MYSTKWLVIFVLLAVLHGCSSFCTTALRRVGTSRAVKSSKNIVNGRIYLRISARTVNDLEDFPDADQISSREALKDDHLPQFTVFEELAISGKDPNVKHRVWERWQERHSAEDNLQLAIRSNLSEDALLPFFDAYKAHLIHDKVAVLNANERFFFSCAVGDMVALQALWAPSPDVVTMTNLYHVAHLEGSNIIGGYQNVLNYYARTTPHFKDYELADINLKFYGDVAVVTCKVRYFNEPKSVTERQPMQVHYVTNVFVKQRDGDRYQLQSHMSSPCALNASLRTQSKIPEKHTYKDPFRKTKPRVPTMEEELSNLFNALKTGRMPSSIKSDGSKNTGDKELSASKVIVDDLTGEEFAVSIDPLRQGSVKSSSGGGANIKVTTMLPTTAATSTAAGGVGKEKSDHVYTPDDIDNISFKEIEQRYRLLTCQDEVLKAIGLRTPEGVNDVLGQEDGVVKSDSAGPFVDLFGELSDSPFDEDAPNASELGKLSDRIAKSTMLNVPFPAETDEAMRKELAFRTQSLLEHLCVTKVITASTLDKLCWDIVEGLTRKECSEVELAYTLLILDGGDEPFKALQTADPHLNSDGSHSYEKVSAEDITDFADFCNRNVRLRDRV